MEINLSKEQYLDLLKICYIGNWVANAQRSGGEDDPMIERYEKIYDHIQSFSQKFGFEEFVEFDEKRGEYYATQKFEFSPDIMETIDEYNDYFFWDELTNRLADRDIKKEYSKKELQKMSFEKFVDEDINHSEIWSEEFEKHGLDRLGIIK